MAGRIKTPQKGKGKSISAPPHVGDSRPAEQRPPTFSLEYLSGDYCITECTTDQRAAFAITLHRLSRLPWSEIMKSHRHGLGAEKLRAKQINARLPRQVAPDVTLLAFRFSGKAPMVGYRDGATFHVLWVDRNFTLYDHG